MCSDDLQLDHIHSLFTDIYRGVALKGNKSDKMCKLLKKFSRSQLQKPL
jgi:hypothetical protein